MRRRFRNVQGDMITDEVQYSLEVMSKKPGCKIYVGSDSQKRRRTIEYCVVIAYRFGIINGRGAHFIYSRWNVNRKGYGKGDALIQKRLMEEIATSIEVATRLQESSIMVHQVDFDLNSNQRWYSNRFVQMAMGWAASLGFNVAVKPDELVAAKAANNIVNG